MLRVNLSDGSVLSLDLSRPEDARRWAELAAGRGQSVAITGLGLQRNGTLHALALPRGFRRMRFFARAVRSAAGEVVACEAGYHADDIRATLTVYVGQPVTRLDVRRAGAVRYHGKGM